MYIHEYQAKQLLNQYGVTILPGFVAENLTQAIDAIKKIEGNKWVLKAQIHAGGRGKAGGIKVASSLEEATAIFNGMLNHSLVTKQTNSKGEIVKKIYIEQACEFDREFYLGLVINRQTNTLEFIFSAAGGVNIEELSPEHFLKLPIDLTIGVQPFHGRKAANFLQITALSENLYQTMNSIYQLFWHYDASLIEINPLVVSKQGQLIALDAKIAFDNNALYRHNDLIHMHMQEQENIDNLDVNYIKLDGNIGCMVNGAGLAMATMDIIKMYGATPANFLDIGGNADQKKVEVSLEKILQDKGVKAILVNIFGGIIQCDLIAAGIVAAVKKIRPSIPLVIRLQGTNAEDGKKILQQSGLDLIAADSLIEAATKVVNLVK